MTEINTELVSKLIKGQFPQWADLPIYPVANSGHDNRTFHLGNEMSVRLPSHESYAAQVEKELTWLPKLRPHLTLPIQVPVAKGNPAEGYLWPWSINRWIEGETVSLAAIKDLNQLAGDLAAFLKELQAIPASDGPPAGAHNFHRGGSLRVYHEETKTTLENLKPILDTNVFHEMWDLALQSQWTEGPVWVHGDVAIGNLLAQNGRLSGVIDFGILGTGDPACDYVMAWTFFDSESREIFLREVGCDEGTRHRARGWALWKALITYDWHDKESAAAVEAKRILDVIKGEY
ncbi:aminoglycoside phosphotransferase family protein [Paenibacillus lignilyticus]|uniref:Aminoglycoside phosphotransferase family protein n=1 Tax=Paenibacillus lignilyticus TaxID=1172615 RepID=A0ABS5CJM1_9BACL|nr:aminoglycoside phosphotransferase family protein [Paenibacillus lignilyticus]MBP3966058.1 aminoglycoside phosphotransferase family protein [Paenibacillus lignilyticus]